MNCPLKPRSNRLQITSGLTFPTSEWNAKLSTNIRRGNLFKRYVFMYSLHYFFCVTQLLVFSMRKYVVLSFNLCFQSHLKFLFRICHSVQFLNMGIDFYTLLDKYDHRFFIRIINNNWWQILHSLNSLILNKRNPNFRLKIFVLYLFYIILCSYINHIFSRERQSKWFLVFLSSLKLFCDIIILAIQMRNSNAFFKYWKSKLSR